MLLGFPAGLQEAISEHDEDVELSHDSWHAYIQVKTRKTGPLQPSELGTTRQRFMALANEHEEGRRAGAARFYLVTNVRPSDKLLRELRSGQWPANTRVVFPSAPPTGDPHVPPAWRDLGEAFAWCAERASRLPATYLDPATIVLKLAGFAQLLSSGEAGDPRHHLSAGAFPALIEQVERSFHTVPPQPASYLPHEREPSPLAESLVRIIVGMSGSGKTAWFAHTAPQLSGELVYVDARAMFARNIREEVIRESCRVLNLTREESRLATFASSPTAGMSVLDGHVGAAGRSYTIAIDNAHSIPNSELVELIEATSNIRWILLLHPIPSLDELSVLTRANPEWLHGWGVASIAKYLRSAGLRASASEIARLRDLTGGVPLFVLNVIELSRGRSSLAETIKDIAAAVSEDLPMQTIMARRILQAMDEQMRTAVSLLALAQIDLFHGEWVAVLEAMGLVTKAAANRLLVHLRNIGVISFGRSQPVRLHDSLVSTVLTGREQLDTSIRQSFYRSLFAMLESLDLRWSQDCFKRRRFVRWVTIMPHAGQTELYSEIVPELAELVVDQPERWLLIEALQGILDNDELSLEHRFWTLQPLAFLHMRSSIERAASAYLAALREVVARMESPGDNVVSALAHLELQFQSMVGNEVEVRRAYARCRELPMEDFRRRIVDFTHAAQLMNFDKYAEAREILERLRGEYMRKVGLTVRDLMKGPKDLSRAAYSAMGDEIDTMAIKHLADVLSYLAACEERLGRAPQYEMIHAAKLYEGARFVPGQLMVGCALVEASLRYMGAPDFALSHSEYLLTLAQESERYEEALLIQRLQIEALLLLGENERASTALGELAPFAAPGTPLAAFVEATAAALGRPRTASRPDAPGFPLSEYSEMVRNIMLVQRLLYARPPRSG